METARSALEALFRQLSADSKPEAVLMAWPVVAGPALASRTRADRLEAQTLHVRVCDQVWKDQLERAHSDLLAALRDVVGPDRVRRIVFAISPVPLREPEL